MPSPFTPASIPSGSAVTGSVFNPGSVPGSGSGGGGGFWTSGNAPVVNNVTGFEFPWGPQWANSTVANGNIEVINKPILYPFRLQSAQTITRLGHRVNATGVGNFDVGIYDTSFNRLVSTGSTARSGALTVQYVTVTTSPLAAGDYYLVLVTDNAAASSTSFIDVAFANILGFWGVRELTGTVFPLPATLGATQACASFTRIHYTCFVKQGATV